MNIHCICWARNEADVLEAHVRHHASFATACTYILHRCRDNSSEILTRLAAEGLPVHFRTDERLLHEQDDVMTSLMHEALAAGADWVLPIDADEFVRGDVRKVLGGSDGSRPLQMPWKGFVPLASDPAEERNVLRRITHRRRFEHPVWHKVIIPRRTVLAHTDTSIAFGNHTVHGGGKVLKAEESTLSIAHFPVRSEMQMRRKLYGSWLTYVANPDRPAGGTFQWEAGFRELKERHSIQPETLMKFALEYAGVEQWNSLPASSKVNSYIDSTYSNTEVQSVVHDPVECDFTLRYEIREADPISVLMETAESVAIDHAKLARQLREASGHGSSGRE